MSPARTIVGRCGALAVLSLVTGFVAEAQADLSDMFPRYWRGRNLICNPASFGYFPTCWYPWPNCGYPGLYPTAPEPTPPPMPAPVPKPVQPEAKHVTPARVDLQPTMTISPGVPKSEPLPRQSDKTPSKPKTR